MFCKLALRMLNNKSHLHLHIYNYPYHYK